MEDVFWADGTWPPPPRVFRSVPVGSLHRNVGGGQVVFYMNISLCKVMYFPGGLSPEQKKQVKFRYRSGSLPPERIFRFVPVEAFHRNVGGGRFLLPRMFLETLL